MNYKCIYCGHIGILADFEIDHIIPVARNPLLSSFLPNLEYICSGCNRQKGKMTKEEYVRWRAFNLLIANYGPIK